MFENFTIEGVKEFYEHIINSAPIKHFYLKSIHIIKTYKGKPKRKMKYKEHHLNGESYESIIPYTGAGACGYGCIVEKVYFRLYYRNINYSKSLCKKGLYLRGLVSSNSRTGGTIIKWKKKCL